MNLLSLEEELRSNAYPGRGIVLGRTPDGRKAVAAYFIMGRSWPLWCNSLVLMGVPKKKCTTIRPRRKI